MSLSVKQSNTHNRLVTSAVKNRKWYFNILFFVYIFIAIVIYFTARAKLLKSGNDINDTNPNYIKKESSLTTTTSFLRGKKSINDFNSFIRPSPLLPVYDHKPPPPRPQ